MTAHPHNWRSIGCVAAIAIAALFPVRRSTAQIPQQALACEVTVYDGVTPVGACCYTCESQVSVLIERSFWWDECSGGECSQTFGDYEEVTYPVIEATLPFFRCNESGAPNTVSWRRVLDVSEFTKGDEHFADCGSGGDELEVLVVFYGGSDAPSQPNWTVYAFYPPREDPDDWTQSPSSTFANFGRNSPLNEK